MENNKKIGLPSSKPPVSISRKKKLTSDMKELYLRRKAHRESLALKNEDIKAANKRYYGNPQDMDIRLENLSTLADRYGVENIKSTKKRRSYYNPLTKTIGISEKSRIHSNVSTDRHRNPINWRERGDMPLGQTELVEYDALEDILIEEIAHAKQQKEKTASWQKGFRNPAHVLGTIVGQPLMDLSSSVGEKTDWKLGKNAIKMGRWLAGYSRPNSLEHEAHSVISPNLMDTYLHGLDKKNVTRKLNYNSKTHEWMFE